MPYSRESLFRLGRLVRKELVEIIRDRRTIITLIMMPLLLYPLLTVAFKQFFLASSIDPNRGIVYRLGFASELEAKVFMEFLDFGEKIEHARNTIAEKTPANPKWKILFASDLEKELREGQVDLVVHVKNPERIRLARNQDIVLDGDVEFVSSHPAALGALAAIERRLAAVNEYHLKSRLHLPGDHPKAALLHLSRTALAVTGADSMISLAALVPLILILMTITGAVYPAIDLTAGERERGTLEILVAAPVPRLGLLFAKYVSVFSVAVLTAFVNLVTMMLTLVFSGLSQVLFADGGLSPLLVLQLFGLLLLFAAFFSAVLLSLTSFARSFKEAQAYLIPLMLASLGPGLVGMIPGLKLDSPLAAAPLVNIVLLARDLVQGLADPAWALVVVVTTLAYAGAAIAVAARIFGAEGVLYNDQSGWVDLLRRPAESRPTATLSGALWCLVLMIPALFALQWLVRLPEPLLPAYWPYIGMAIVGAVLFGVFPVVGAFMGRVRFITGFGLNSARPMAYLGGIILGVSLWPWVFALLTVLLRNKLEQLQQILGPALETLKRDRETMLPVVVASLAIQGFLEELFFRGYLLRALGRQLSPVGAVGMSALLFGLLHVVMGVSLGLERLVPSILLGLILGWVSWTAGSVVPAMLLHACHNALINVLPSFLDLKIGQDVPWTWLAAGAAGSVIGAVLLWSGKKQPMVPHDAPRP